MDRGIRLRPPQTPGESTVQVRHPRSRLFFSTKTPRISDTMWIVYGPQTQGTFLSYPTPIHLPTTLSYSDTTRPRSTSESSVQNYRTSGNCLSWNNRGPQTGGIILKQTRCRTRWLFRLSGLWTSVSRSTLPSRPSTLFPVDPKSVHCRHIPLWTFTPICPSGGERKLLVKVSKGVTTGLVKIMREAPQMSGPSVWVCQGTVTIGCH